MMKRLLSILLVLGILLGCAIPAFAEETDAPAEKKLTIRSEKAFLKFAENCRLDSYSQNLTVSLETDIDLEGLEFTDIPIFCGTLEGNGHTVRGLDLTGEGSVRGLFRYLTETAVIRDLTVQGSVCPVGSRNTVGGIAGSNAGRMESCTFNGHVTGNQSVGGLVGINAVGGVIENCQSEGVISGIHFTGGIAGENRGVIRDSRNLAVVNTTAQQNEVSLSDITLDALMNTEDSHTVTDIGGIAGNSTGVIRGCSNRGNIGYQHMGYNIGGIAGSQSGYIVDCVNHGEILGRKEVGGIVGQMEPAARIEYEADALQILEQQLSAMSATIDKAAANAWIGGQEMQGQIGALQDSMESAKESLESLTPDPENPELPDSDSIQAAQNGIADSLSSMTSTLQGMGETTSSTMGALSNDLYRLQDQLNAMRGTLNNVSETLGGSLADVSDEDTAEDLTGKVEGCENHGDVLADINAGGIVGAMALENDLDPEDDWQISGRNSLNFESELRAVVTGCENDALVTVRKQHAGGIAGWVSMGLVKNCINSGSLDAAGAEGVGGIAGASSGYLRENAARCVVSGGTAVGGIAGSATVVTDCYSLVQLQDVQEEYGAVIGLLEDPQREMEAPVSGNRYLAAHSDPGGIDGVSYEGLAQAAERETFLAEENLPEMFRTVTVQFRDAGGRITRFRLTPGEGLKETDIPPVPLRDGHEGIWEGLEETDLSEVYFDRSFQAVYTDEAAVIQSEDLAESGKPIMLLEGGFSSNARILLEKPDVSAMLANGQTLLDHWQYTLEGEGDVSRVRLCLPEDADKEHLKLMVMESDGLWTETDFHVEGSYAVIATEAQTLTLAVIQEPGNNWLLVGIAGLGALAVLAFVLSKKKKKA